MRAPRTNLHVVYDGGRGRLHDDVLRRVGDDDGSSVGLPINVHAALIPPLPATTLDSASNLGASPTWTTPYDGPGAPCPLTPDRPPAPPSPPVPPKQYRRSPSRHAIGAPLLSVAMPPAAPRCPSVSSDPSVPRPARPPVEDSIRERSNATRLETAYAPMDAPPPSPGLPERPGHPPAPPPPPLPPKRDRPSVVTPSQPVDRRGRVAARSERGE